MPSPRTAKSTLSGVVFHGNLLIPDILNSILEPSYKGQLPEDFGLPQGIRIEDELAVAWGDVKAYWYAFKRQSERLSSTDSATSVTREMLALPLLRTLGYQVVPCGKREMVGSTPYSISHRAVPVPYDPEAIFSFLPIHIIGCRQELEKLPKRSITTSNSEPITRSSRISAHSLVQEYLNATEHLWAIASNGIRWRLLRDSSLLTRLSYIEFNLEQIIQDENFAEFSLFYRLFHRSRLPISSENPETCLLEDYYQKGLEEGGRVREKLRDGVEKALEYLGNGFLQHWDNDSLRQKLHGPSGDQNLYRQLLRLIYRLLFLMVAESRNLLLLDSESEKGKIYNRYYSIQRLRVLAEILPSGTESFQDLWCGLCITFKLFDEKWRGSMLDLSPLNGDLFGSESLTLLETSSIDNSHLLNALRCLSLYYENGQIRKVNYGALDVEELGSVYESLLDFHPQITLDKYNSSFKLVVDISSERKTTGSYYTPPSLVQELIKTALEPVIKEKMAQENEKTQERAILSIKVVDAACGSGHFLLAAARRLGKELAKIRTGDIQPGASSLREAIREVIQNCIYGVDINPLAVDLCKVGLWIEGFCSGKPLNFLDHRIKCGNSLVGVLDLECLEEGIPDGAFKAISGDDKKIVTGVKKRNKRELGSLQLVMPWFEEREETREEYMEKAEVLGEVSEIDPESIKEKSSKYEELRSDMWSDYSACNLWTAAFFISITEKTLELLPTNSILMELLKGNLSSAEIIKNSNELAKKYHFFHWQLEFPEVFKNGGFDCVLGNPPWERIKIQQKEFFASRSNEIATAKNKAAREKLIKELPQKNPQLAQEFEQASHDAEAQNKFIRESGRFPLTAVGDVNTYSIFAETARNLIKEDGRVGIIVPTGIATDDTCKMFFGDLVKQEHLASLYDFENREAIFIAVHRSYKFCLLGISKRRTEESRFGFFLSRTKQLEEKNRVFNLKAEEIALINPNTLTCPVFRTSEDAQLTKKIYHQLPVIENEKTGINPWGISFMRMFDMANDSGVFKNEKGDSLVPLYEAKMFHQFDHRWGTYTSGGDMRDLTEDEKKDPSFVCFPRYWVDKTEVDQKLAGKWDHSWFLAFRRICRATDERTAIFSLLPRVAAGDSVFLVLIESSKIHLASCLYGCLNSLVFDYVTRQKVGGTNFNFFIVKQLPIIPPERYTQKDIEYITPRVLELVYTTWDMRPFALEMGYEGEPFFWNIERRALIRAELDAYYGKLHNLSRDEMRYILDPTDIYGSDFPSESFRVLKNNELKMYGEYKTQRLILQAWDRLF
ncbi:Eco57I restriction-modification methylase domain-containing protein [Cylindrospermopsis raciborskii]|nr:N-6 DNA methylase [Cylindrospermopsis raciborskii]